MKKILKVGCIILIIFFTIGSAGLYFSFPYLKKKIIKLALKTAGIQDVELKGINFSKTHFSINHIKIIKNSDNIYEINGLKTKFSDYKNFYYKKLFLDSIIIDTVNLKLDIALSTKDTAPLDFKNIFVIPKFPLAIDIKKINIKNISADIKYSNKIIQLAGLTLNADIQNLNNILTIKLNSNNPTGTIKYKFQTYNFELKKSEAAIAVLICDTEIITAVSIRSKTYYSDVKNNFKIAHSLVLLKNTAKINTVKKAIETSASFAFEKAAAIGISMDINYDTFITALHIKTSPSFVNFSEIIKSTEYKFNLPGISLRTNSEFVIDFPDTSSFNLSLTKKTLSVKNLSLKFNLKNIDAAQSGAELKNLNCSGNLYADGNFSAGGGLPANLTFRFKNTVSASSLIYSNIVKIEKPNLSIILEKNKNSKLLNYISQLSDTLVRISPTLLHNLANSIDTYNLTLSYKSGSFKNNFEHRAVSFVCSGFQNQQHIEISAKTSDFAISEKPQIIIPSSYFSIKGNIKDFKTASFISSIIAPALGNCSFSIYIEEEQDLITLLSNKHPDFNAIYDKAFWRIQSDDFKIRNKNIKSFFPSYFNIPVTGTSSINFKFLKKPFLLPAITLSAHFEKINYSDTVSGFGIEDGDLLISLDNFIIGKKTKKEASGIILNTPALDKNKNFHIKRLYFKDIRFDNISGNFEIKQNNFYFNNIVFDFLKGSGSLNLYADLNQKNISFSSRFENININAFNLKAGESSGGIISAALDLKMKNLMQNNKIFNLNDAEGSLVIAKLNKNTIYSLLNTFDPENKDFNSSKLRLALKYAEPTQARISIGAGLMNIGIQFNSKLIKEFKIDRVNISKLKFLNDFLKL